MSQELQVKDRIFDAIARLETIHAAGVKAPVSSNPDAENGQSDDEITERMVADEELSEEKMAALRERLRAIRTKFITMQKMLDDEREKHRSELDELNESMTHLRQSYAALSAQHDKLQEALRWGTVDAGTIDKNMAAELNALRAERSLERQELLMVQRQLEAFLKLGERLDTDHKETEQVEDS